MADLICLQPFTIVVEKMKVRGPEWPVPFIIEISDRAGRESNRGYPKKHPAVFQINPG
jgi:hypothetical protein